MANFKVNKDNRDRSTRLCSFPCLPRVGYVVDYQSIRTECSIYLWQVVPFIPNKVRTTHSKDSDILQPPVASDQRTSGFGERESYM